MASIYSVSQINQYIKNMFAQDFALSRVSIKGEISNCKYHTSGHIYFTLKDRSGTLAAVMFVSQRRGLKFQLQDGQQVVVAGNIDVYERDGKYQLYAKSIELDGQGDLFERFQKLRDELEEMGMFAPEYKQPIPQYAKTVGIVTASTGAAIQDIINISRRRNPYIQLILYPALVQGEQAKHSIVKGIQTLDQMGLDLLIIGRGGGSIEDLWAFNEEVVARAIFECRTPVISAVGHETDVTIADYVADMRAPTPSAAAELAVFDYQQYCAQLRYYYDILGNTINQKVERKRELLTQRKYQLKTFDPQHQINNKRQYLVSVEDRLGYLIKNKLEQQKHRLAVACEIMQGLSPMRRLEKGFGFITDQSDKRVISIKQVERGQIVQVRISDGVLRTKVEEIEETDYGKKGKIH